jgi:hypothetical protein
MVGEEWTLAQPFGAVFRERPSTPTLVASDQLRGKIAAGRRVAGRSSSVLTGPATQPFADEARG